MTASTALQSYQLLIDGQMVDAASGETFETVSPATNRRSRSVAKAGMEDVDRAVAAARQAFDDGPLVADAAGRARRAHAARLADLIRERVDELARLETLNSGKIIVEARADVLNSAACLDYYASLAGTGVGRDDPDERAAARLHGARADRRLRADHPVELPAADGGLEARRRRWPPATRSSSSRPATRRVTAVILGQICQEAGIPDGVSTC